MFVASILAVLFVLARSCRLSQGRVIKSAEGFLAKRQAAPADSTRTLADGITAIEKEGAYWMGLIKAASGVGLIVAAISVSDLANPGAAGKGWVGAVGAGVVAYFALLAGSARIGPPTMVGQQVNRHYYEDVAGAVRRRIVYAHICVAVCLLAVLYAAFWLAGPLK